MKHTLKKIIYMLLAVFFIVVFLQNPAVAVEPNEEDEKIKWIRNAQDILVVTCEYPVNVDLLNAKIDANSTIVTYDDKELKASSDVMIKDDIDGIVTSEIKENENEIYKGKIYAEEDREYISNTIVNVDYADAVEEIQINEKVSTFVSGNETINANIEYEQSKIRKSEFDKIEDFFIFIAPKSALAKFNP